MEENLNPEQVMEFMETIRYGWMGIDDCLRINTIEQLPSLYRTSSNEEIIKNKAGICFDQVELERSLFSEEYHKKSYAIFTRHMVHSFLTLEKEDQYIYFEHSSSKDKGIYYFSESQEMLAFAVEKFMHNHNIRSKEQVKLVFYEPIPPDTTFKEIIQKIQTSSIDNPKKHF